jgi:NADH:ubiquinone oxidoreductase subunit 3 (subunit A)
VARSRLPVVPFTGGLPPVKHAVSRFHVRWFALVMPFLASDMEMIVTDPWTRGYRSHATRWLVTSRSRVVPAATTAAARREGRCLAR